MKNILTSALKNSFTYSEYRQLFETLVKEQRTTGDSQTEEKIAFTKLNHSRMKRWDKTYKPAFTFGNVNPAEAEIWLVIVEAWCGDAAQNVPVLNKIAEQMQNVELRLVLRDDNPELMDRFLTNGSKSIPKLIRLQKSNLEVLGTWGARPAAAAHLLAEYKANPEITHDMFNENMARWYVADNGKSVEEDMLQLLDAGVPA